MPTISEWESRTPTRQQQIVFGVMWGVLFGLPGLLVIGLVLEGGFGSSLILALIPLIIIDVLLVYLIIDFSHPNWGLYKGVQQARREVFFIVNKKFLFKTIKRWLEGRFTIKKENPNSYLNCASLHQYRRVLEVQIRSEDNGTLVTLYEKAIAFNFIPNTLIKDEITQLDWYLENHVRQFNRLKVELSRVSATTEKPTLNECPFCESPVNIKALFCEECGTSVEVDAGVYL